MRGVFMENLPWQHCRLEFRHAVNNKTNKIWRPCWTLFFESLYPLSSGTTATAGARLTVADEHLPCCYSWNKVSGLVWWHICHQIKTAKTHLALTTLHVGHYLLRKQQQLSPAHKHGRRIQVIILTQCWVVSAQGHCSVRGALPCLIWSLEN